MKNDDPTLAYSKEMSKETTKPRLRVLFEGGRGAVDGPTRDIDDREFDIGRSVEDNGLQLDDARASRRHATIRSSYGGSVVEIEDRSRNGTFVDGARIDADRRHTLQDGNLIQIGNSFLLFRFKSEESHEQNSDELKGDAPSMHRLRRTITAVAPTDATVLVNGESGTGKELVARAIHQASGRDGPFVPVNCSAIPETLAESELFGHVAGSFTGARTDHKGHFENAHKGTLFLDELGELPINLQPKLLRVLEERAVTRLGSSTPKPIDVRVIAATNVNLAQAIRHDRFRGDLYARLAEITIATPPLRQRREDILQHLAEALGPDAPPLAPKLVRELLLFRWPFNVRQLLKIATQLKIHGAGAQRLEFDLIKDQLIDPLNSQTRPRHPTGKAPNNPTVPSVSAEAEAQVRDKVPTREEFIELVRDTQGNISKLSRALGRSRRQIYRYIEMYELNIEEYR